LDAQSRIIAAFQAREIIYLDPQIPAWLNEALEQTAYTAQNLIACFLQKQPLPDPTSSN
jgi:hypothetical protein